MEWFVFLGGAAVAAVINVGFSVWKHIDDRRAQTVRWDKERADEHARWLRDKKLEVYVEFLAGLQAVRHQTRIFIEGGKDEHGQEIMNALGDLPVSLMQVLAPLDVSQKGAEAMMALNSLVSIQLDDRESDHSDLVRSYSLKLATFQYAVSEDLAAEMPSGVSPFPRS